MDALALARHAQHQLGLGQSRDAAWLALLSLERDGNNGLALTVLARLMLEVNEDPLATIATSVALEMGVPEEDRLGIERYHRIDLWTRGFLSHAERAAILPVDAFDEAANFDETPRYAPWFSALTAEWGDAHRAADALIKMAAALADARVVPKSEDNPLRADGWEDTELYGAWKQTIQLGDPPPRAEEKTEGLTVLSDYWIEQEIASLGASANFGAAIERANLWAQLRPHKIGPKAALVRLHHASDDFAARNLTIEQILALDTHDLNELEEARLALGELGLWQPQVKVLDRMDALAPAHPVILANRGAARLELGDAAAAAVDLELAIERDPDNGPALATLGLIRMRADDYDAARPLLERAVEIAPEQPQVRVYLAACLNNQGDKSGGIEQLKRALELDPDHAQARQLLADLS